MTGLVGTSYLGLSRAGRGDHTFQGHNPMTGTALEPTYHVAGSDDVEHACRLASQAFESAPVAPAARSGLLRAVADGIEGEADALVTRAHAETGLPLPRLQSELGRTTAQLRLFASVVDEGSWVDARLDLALPERKPLPRPDVRSLRQAVGPVVVFGSSNFPLAFSVAGGDTASALAAGNPVIVKAHPAHPGTSEIVGAVICEAVRSRGLHEGTFSLLFDDGFAVGSALVQHPFVRAVGFTGSRAGGEALQRLAAARPHPIPVYAEMGSVNPVLILPRALEARGRAIAEGLHASFTLGVGQFCTNPGMVLLERSGAGDVFAERLVELTRNTAAGTMLTAVIAGAYRQGLERLGASGASTLMEGLAGDEWTSGRAVLFQVEAAAALANPRLLDEVFGPSTLLVRYRDAQELEQLLRSLDGQLTTTVHAEPGELAAHATLLRLLADKSGRVVVNQFPTGVEVGHAMVHGGPFPATTDPGSTSVGTRAITRFTRLVAYQNVPQECLPPELQDTNPLAIRRLINGEPSSTPV